LRSILFCRACPWQEASRKPNRHRNTQASFLK
jgi:hypothetical protein